MYSDELDNIIIELENAINDCKCRKDKQILKGILKKVKDIKKDVEEKGK